MGKIRLHQFLSKCGVFESKRELKNAVWKGLVEVNGSQVRDISFEFNPLKRKVTFKGERLFLPEKESYFLLNKPPGFICSRIGVNERGLGKKSVFDLFAGKIDDVTFNSLVTVGRLDEDTTGFLLLTTDGKMVQNIANPVNNVSKTYLVRTEGRITERQVSKIREGVFVSISDGRDSENYVSKPSNIFLEDQCTAVLTIAEGKKREIRRIFQALGNFVEDLHRVSIGEMQLSEYGLDEGEYLEITLQEIEEKIIGP